MNKQVVVFVVQEGDVAQDSAGQRLGMSLVVQQDVLQALQGRWDGSGPAQLSDHVGPGKTCH